MLKKNVSYAEEKELYILPINVMTATLNNKLYSNLLEVLIKSLK